MIRTHLVKSLYANLVGPINGPTETVEQPYTKYQVGILESCFHSNDEQSAVTGTQELLEEKIINSLNRNATKSAEALASDDNDVQWPDTEIDLGGSFTLGLSFVLKGESPKIQICSTWGRYVRDGETPKDLGIFHRKPNYFLTDWLDVSSYQEESESSKIKFEPKGLNIITKLGVELRIRSTYNSKNKNWSVQVFLVNNTGYKDKKDDGTPKRQTEEDRVFQPQIRINCKDSQVDFLGNDDDSLAYFNKKTVARGFQCGAIWEDVDPEGTDEGEFRKFTWPDAESKLIPKQIVDDFTCPKIRTEYLPTYSIMQPEASLRTYDAKFFSNCWDFEKIYNGVSKEESGHSGKFGLGLKQLTDSYKKWIDEQDVFLKSSDFPESKHDDGKEIIKKCNESLSEINNGINFLRDNERARLAFCFMNSVISDNSKNSWLIKNENRDPSLEIPSFSWKEFQMAFILQSLRGVTGFDKDEQKKTDVLWFPTGGGKTEAYLGIIVFASAYRRLMDLDKSETESQTSLNNDGGVCAISRYTLRLLTIQQFQRALGVFVVSDLKRVCHWIPKDMMEHSLKFETEFLNKKYISKNLWGGARFSIGLWIGSAATPGRFPHMYNASAKKAILNAEGFLMSSIEQQKKFKGRIESENSDPAQVRSCPVCGNVLCLSDGEKIPEKTLTWIVKTNKNLDSLKAIPKNDFQDSMVKIVSGPLFSELSETLDGFRFIRVSMKISLNKKNPDKIRSIIDTWWHHAVEPKFTSSNIPSLSSTRASMPGYFYLKKDNRPYDFVIHCTSKDCTLNNNNWHEKTPTNNQTRIPKPFVSSDPCVSTSIPISAYTVDEQIYARCPTFIISTSDKFARLPWDPRCASLFGNVDSFHDDWGYGRDVTFRDLSFCNVPLVKDKKRERPDPSELSDCRGFLPPSLIVQDELHLIEGPLGSMVGAYEMAIDVLCRHKDRKPKYIASSATIKESETQVGTLYRTGIRVFPRPGLFSEDNFFAKINEDISCTRSGSGRLYLGICSGKSTYELPIKAMAILMSEIHKVRENPEFYGLSKEQVAKEIDPYWTHVSYFSDLQLMSKFTGYYGDDIKRDIENMSPLRIGNSDTSCMGKIPKGASLVPITSDRDLSIWGVSVYSDNTKGNLAVAIYSDNQPDSKWIWKSNKEKCTKGENSFFSTSSILKIKKGETVWVALINDSDETSFHLTDSVETWYELEPVKIYSVNTPWNELITENNDIRYPKILGKSKKREGNPIRIELTGKRRDVEKLPITLSSETKSEDLSKYLERLQISLEEKGGEIQDSQTADALLTSPVFGTGIDVDRLGLMAIMNQPKTTSGYIQATGRVGRQEPGLVITWLRARRARDLDHYENFIGYHRKIHSFVEPVTANPFSHESLELCLGPIIVSILRNAKYVDSVPIPPLWVSDEKGPFQILKNKYGDSNVISAILRILNEIGKSSHIPIHRRNNKFKQELNSQIKKWYDIAEEKQQKGKILPYGQTNPKKPATTDVVLGSPFHEVKGLDAVFSNTRNSMRDTESTAIFYNQSNKAEIRPSQFITRYGPGSLLPTTGASITAPSIGRMFGNLDKPIGNFRETVDGKQQLNKIEINDVNMSRILFQINKEKIPFDDLHIFSMPTNTSLNSTEKNVDADQDIYQGELFPEWGICSRHTGNRIFGKIVYNPRNNTAAVKCPLCKNKYGDRYSTSFSSVRFVLACRKGHMSDLDWTKQIHGIDCNEDVSDDDRVYTWNESGGGDNIVFRCYGVWKKKDSEPHGEYDNFVETKCNQEKRLTDLKGLSNTDRLPCQGKFVENTFSSERCTAHAKFVLKSMMSLRSPVIYSTLVVEPHKTHLFNKLCKNYAGRFREFIMDLNDDKPDWDQDDVANKIEKRKNQNTIEIGDELIREIRKSTRKDLEYVDSELKKHLDHIHSGDIALSEKENLEDELDSLKNVVKNGLEEGIVQQGPSSKSIVFPIQWSSSVSGLRFEAMPFNNIKVTNIQTGYSREIDNGDDSDEIDKYAQTRTGKIVSKFSKYTDRTNDNVWYLGNQNIGEGIFIQLQPENEEHKSTDAFSIFEKDNVHFTAWNDYNQKATIAIDSLLDKKDSTYFDQDNLEGIKMKTNPLFVWWHSFAHQIITELAIDSGFTTTSLSERVYCIKKEDGTFSAGILLYVATPGSDGTLGGLTSLVDKNILPNIISNAERHLLSCSNDPVCYERKFDDNRHRGAACHACLMSPETTCSYQNKYLDRNLIRGTIEK